MKRRFCDRSLAGIFLGAFVLLRKKTEAFHQRTNIGLRFHFDHSTRSHDLSRTNLPNLFASPSDPTSDKKEQRSPLADKENAIDPAVNDEDFKAWFASRVK